MAGSSVLLLLLLLLAVTLQLVPAQRIRERRQSLKVRINATDDTIVMTFVRPSADVKLEGYILGYGGGVFSKQFIPLPEDGEPYQAEMDAEPKYLIAVQPIPTNDVKKHCTGKVNLEKPLHLVIGSVSPTAVLLSWGNMAKTPYEGNILDECLEDGFYTIRYRERNRKWIYQTCPTSDTVVDNLKPNTPYEFGVRSNKDENSGTWSKPVVHNTNMGNKNPQKTFKLRNPLMNPLKPHGLFPPRPALHNATRGRFSTILKNGGFPGAPRTFDTENLVRSAPHLPEDPPIAPWFQATQAPQTSTTVASRITVSPTSGHSSHGRTTEASIKAPNKPPHSAAVSQSKDRSALLRSLANERAQTNSWGLNSRSLSPNSPALPQQTGSARPLFPLYRPNSWSPTSGVLGVNGQPHGGSSAVKPALWSRPRLGSPARPSIQINKKPNLVGKPGETDKVNSLKQSVDLPLLKTKVPTSPTAKPTKPERRQTTTTTAAPTPTATRQETWEESDLFKAQPTSDLDALGKKRYVAPHVVYKTGKKPDEPCSITSSLNFFPESEPGETNVTAPPRSPPSNLTVVTVEGCPSFVILDWEKTDNDTTEYEVISTAKGPDGEQVSILTTNQTHTAVENLKPESSYEFKVKPKNELGTGPPSEPVSFNTESADPRVSENVSGKDAIWTQFPFKTDSYSDCHGKQYVKRTWYRKFVGVQLCNSLRYKIYLSDSLNGKFYNIGDQTGFGEDHCQFVDSFLDGRTGRQLQADQLPSRAGFYRAVRQEPVHFGQIGGRSHISYVSWYECGTPIPGKW
ncbi:ABI family, member 3 (NESH) binding protein b isoform X2 [Salarias fasciatus]|uniref:ABI family, member 3 (NESH) binding protein b isoform X2 n=1 Tax=Salarias fasciatus TaxID=181472 RepID=UPI0011765B56|nr:target of Nesh-SH3-like isoform X2 [Salarias fasciatus]